MSRTDLERAKQLLEADDPSGVLCCGEDIITWSDRGLITLLRLHSLRSFSGYAAADRVVGKAAAFIYQAIGVTELYASLISEPGLSTLVTAGVHPHYGVCVPSILNRSRDDLCPMEMIALSTDDPEVAIDGIRASATQRGPNTRR